MEWQHRLITGISIAFALTLLTAVPSTAQQWPNVPPDALIGAAPPKPFSFETGLRYWYSSGTVNFAFTNTNPAFGNPTSTIDWNSLTAHTGEIFARLDHAPTGLFVKGLIGSGSIQEGDMIDRDFLVGQLSFSDTSSHVGNGTITYGIIDIGATIAQPAPGVRFGAFVGYQYWHDKMTAYGLICNADAVGGMFCGPPGSSVYPNSVPVLQYEPTWHAARIGFDGHVQIDNTWSISGELAAVPYARVTNDDSHLLRQSPADLGPAPNIITRNDWAWGGEAEVFVNYALTNHIDIGAGLRYWGLFNLRGRVEFGPDFSVDYPVNRFYQQRYGLLLQIRGRL